ncbi:MAG TPA: sugar phosphate isomerase/epimerase [Bryobacteraceae bacterium]|jgi:sugar phosphate isomerase/epimerase
MSTAQVQSLAARWSLSTIVLAPRGGNAISPRAKREELLSWASRAGFGAVEISGAWVDVYTQSHAERQMLAAEIANSSLAISGVNLDRVLDRCGNSAVLERGRFGQVLRVAEDLGAPLISISFSVKLGPTVLRAADFDDAVVGAFAREAKQLARDAAGSGIQLSFELHDDGILDSAEACLRFLERVHEPNTGVNPDLGNLMRDPAHPGHDWRSTLRALAPRTNCWHVKNYRDARQTPLDEGDIDFEEACLVIHNAGVAPPISIEDRSGEYRTVQSRGLQFMKRAMKAAVEAQ